MDILLSARDCAVPRSNGPGTWAHNVAKHLSESNEILVHSKMYYDLFRPYESLEGYHIFRFPRYPLRLRKYLWPVELFTLYRLTDPDCVLFRIPDAGVLSSVNQYKKFLSSINVPVIGRFTFSPRSWPNGISTLIGELDAIICETESQRNYIKKTYNVTTEITPIVPNGVDVEKFGQPQPPANGDPIARQVSSFTDSFENVYGFVGCIDKYRCVKEIISGFVAYLSSKPSAGLVIAGDGDQLEDCKQLVREFGILDKVLFLGHVDHGKVPYLLSEMDLVFALSHPEVIDYTTPIKLFEALGASIPVIASDGGDFHKYVDESVGILISDHEPESIAQGIQTVTYRHYQSESFERKVRPYSWDSYADRVTNIAQELVN